MGEGVDFKRASDVRLFDFEELSPGHNAGVVDQDVRISDLSPDFVGNGADLVRLRQITHVAVSSPAVPLDFLSSGIICNLKYGLLHIHLDSER